MSPILAVDMFPRTRKKSDINSEQSSHVETVCLLVNQNAQAKHHVNVGLGAEDYCKTKGGNNE